MAWKDRLAGVFEKKRSKDELHCYWRNPTAGNTPVDYLAAGEYERSHALERLLSKFFPKSSRVLEIGCNSGRNLLVLRRAGWLDLSGIELNPMAVHLMRNSFPELNDVQVWEAPVEYVIKDFKDGEFDVIFTMATLEHLHSESEWVFKEMARVAGYGIVTVEDEETRSERHFPRSYAHVFANLGYNPAYSKEMDGLPTSFRARVFMKENKG